MRVVTRTPPSRHSAVAAAALSPASSEAVDDVHSSTFIVCLEAHVT